MQRNILLGLIVLLSYFPLNSLSSIHDKEIVGKIEKVILVDYPISIDAKLDSGATMSSLSAKNITIFKRKNQNWVHFTVYLPAIHKEIVFNKLLIRSIHIVKRNEEYARNNTGSHDKQYGIRPVIAMTVCLGKHKETILVNLIDRTHFHYPMLIGSDALKKFQVIIDVSHHYLVLPQCDLGSDTP